jgi:hypothetical protein
MALKEIDAPAAQAADGSRQKKDGQPRQALGAVPTLTQQRKQAAKKSADPGQMDTASAAKNIRKHLWGAYGIELDASCIQGRLATEYGVNIGAAQVNKINSAIDALCRQLSAGYNPDEASFNRLSDIITAAMQKQEIFKWLAGGKLRDFASGLEGLPLGQREMAMLATFKEAKQATFCERFESQRGRRSLADNFTAAYRSLPYGAHAPFFEALGTNYILRGDVVEHGGNAVCIKRFTQLNGTVGPLSENNFRRLFGAFADCPDSTPSPALALTAMLLDGKIGNLLSGLGKEQNWLKMEVIWAVGNLRPTEPDGKYIRIPGEQIAKKVIRMVSGMPDTAAASAIGIVAGNAQLERAIAAPGGEIALARKFRNFASVLEKEKNGGLAADMLDVVNGSDKLNGIFSGGSGEAAVARKFNTFTSILWGRLQKKFGDLALLDGKENALGEFLRTVKHTPMFAETFAKPNGEALLAGKFAEFMDLQDKDMLGRALVGIHYLEDIGKAGADGYIKLFLDSPAGFSRLFNNENLGVMRLLKIERFDPAIVNHVIGNVEKIRRGEAVDKLVLVILNEYDWNGGFLYNQQEYKNLIANGYRLLICETEEDTDLAARLLNFGSVSEVKNPSQYSGVIIGGHGDTVRITLGSRDEEKSYLGLEDYNKNDSLRRGAWAKMLKDNAFIVLEACSTGGKAINPKDNPGNFKNVMEMIADLAYSPDKNATVYAPKRPTHPELVLKNGKLEGLSTYNNVPIMKISTKDLLPIN